MYKLLECSSPMIVCVFTSNLKLMGMFNSNRHINPPVGIQQSEKYTRNYARNYQNRSTMVK